MKYFTNNGLTFDVLDGGPARAEHAVVLLHGFPQTNHAWMDVVPVLHEEGVRTLAPALRGYSPGAMPEGIRPYRIEYLVRDVLALLDQAGLEKAHVVGHDWGGGIAWQAAMQFPERVNGLTILSTPHPGAMRQATKTSTQGLKSWYMAAMAIPKLPEALITWGVRRRGLKSLDLPVRHEEAYREWIEQPDAARAMIGAYRALFIRPPRDAFAFDTRVQVPTTYLWGNRDAYLGRAAAELTAGYVTGPYRFLELDEDHWLPERRPVQVAREVLADLLS